MLGLLHGRLLAENRGLPCVVSGGACGSGGMILGRSCRDANWHPRIVNSIRPLPFPECDLKFQEFVSPMDFEIHYVAAPLFGE
ncbi:MAG: hypothetical protein JWN70_6790 [Planctomycetaceae bacterium]|nr:hypothetical protein [Planctomycetaceae bacterium]